MTTLGELVGFGLVGVLALGLFAGEEPGPLRLLLFCALAALTEGGILAYAQWRILRERINIRYASWAFATIWPAALAYIAGMWGGPALGTSGLSIPVLLALGILLAALLGALLGTGQWLALRSRAHHANAWIPASAIAWTGGLILSVGGVSLASDLSPIGLVIVASAASGLAMGAFVGIVMSYAFDRIAARG